MHRRPAQRYGMHDLLRAYARESAEAALPEVERRAAIGRLHDFYRHTVYQLRDVLIPRGILSEPAEPAVPMSFDGEPARQTWAAVERANLVATAVAAAHDGWSGYVREMTYCLWPYLYQSGYGEECLSLSTAALDAARAAGDVDAEATALNHAAGALATLGRYAETVEYGEASLRLYRIQGDDPIAEARLLSNLSEVYATLGRSRQAKANAEEATRLRREHAGSVTIASGLATLAILDLNLGLVDEALGHARESVARYDATDLPLIWERVEALDALGQVLLRLGRLDEAREQLARAHEISRSAAHGDHLHSQTLTLLATVCRRQGDPGAAEGLAQEGLALANGTGDPELISAALAELAQLRREQDRAADAVREARRALSVAAEAGHRRAEMIAHRVLGETLIAGGAPAAGDRHLDAALGIALEVEDPYEQELARGQRNRQNG
jgi:tetratricopeptide (TPR) repeat protein